MAKNKQYGFVLDTTKAQAAGYDRLYFDFNGNGDLTDAYATASLYSAAIREGCITQGTKRTKLVLLDHNSNGRFDDTISLQARGAAVEGDLLLVNPNPKNKLPFGAPFHAEVSARRSGESKVSLSLAIVGAAGEKCTSFYVNGSRPPQPRFVIKDKGGKIVHQGSFEYG